MNAAPEKPEPNQPTVRVAAWQKPLVFISGHSVAYLERATKSDLGYAVALGLVALIPVFSGSIAMYIALKTHLSGDHAETICLISAAVFGLIILSIDRFLMAMPMRRIDVDTANGQVTLRNGPAWTVLVAAAPRVLTAILISFILAEPLLVKYFNPEVEQRLEMMRSDLAIEAVERQTAENKKNAESRPEYTPQQQRYVDLADKIIPEQEKSIAAQKQTVAECRRYYQNELKGGRTVTDAEGCKPEGGPSSGRSGDGPKAAAAQANLRAAEEKLTNMQAELSRFVSERDATPASVVNSVSEKQSNDRDRAAGDQTKIDDAREKALATDGLLIRMSALEELAYDKTPFSKEPAVSSNEDGEKTSETGVETASFLGITLMGMQIWAARLIIMLFDTMPILGKVLLAFRKRRVYDEIVAIDQHRHTEQEKLTASAGHIRRSILQSSMEESARAFIQDAGGAWIATKNGWILVGPDGSVFAPLSHLQPDTPHSDNNNEPGIRFSGSEEGDVSAEETTGKPWPDSSDPDIHNFVNDSTYERVDRLFPDDASLDDPFLDTNPPKKSPKKDANQPASEEPPSDDIIDLRDTEPKDASQDRRDDDAPDDDEPGGQRR